MNTHDENEKFAKEYTQLQGVVEERTKKFKGLESSFLSLQEYIDESGEAFDLSELSQIIERERQVVQGLVDMFTAMKAERIKRKTQLTSSMKHMFAAVNALIFLDGPGIPADECKEGEDEDSLMVEMSRFLYPNKANNLQLRRDPPIAGHYKQKFEQFELVSQFGSQLDGKPSSGAKGIGCL